MRLLLDTHVFLWWWSGNRKLSKSGRDSIAGAQEAFISAVTAWEIVIKMALGRLRFEGSIRGAIDACRFAELPVTVHHTEALLKLPLHHADLFDRMLIAQATVERLTIVTHDRAFEQYRVPIVLT